MKKLISVALALISLAVASTVAYASPMLQIVDSSSNPVTPGSFPLVPTGSPDANNSMSIGTSETGTNPFPVGTPGYASSYLNLTAASNLIFTLTGDGDAAYNNQFCATSATATTNCFTLHVNPFGTTFELPFTAGLVNFTFTSGNGQTASNTPGGNNYSVSSANFFITDFSTTSVTSTSMDLGLSDAGSTSDSCGGVAGDCDFQDMRVSVTVPEPDSVFLIGIGLLGLHFASRRGKQPI